MAGVGTHGVSLKIVESYRRQKEIQFAKWQFSGVTNRVDGNSGGNSEINVYIKQVKTVRYKYY